MNCESKLGGVRGTKRTSGRAARLGMVALLAAVAGSTLWTALALAQPEDPRNALRERNRLARERQIQEGQIPPDSPMPVELMDPGADPNGGAAVVGGAVGGLAGVEGRVTLNFPNESVEIGAFADYVSKALGVNIYVDEGVSSQRIVFKAPLEVPIARLLPLLSAFVEDRGFALVQHPLGWYQIQPAANVIPNIKGDELSTTRVIRTPLVKPSALQAAIQTSLGQAANSARITAFDELGALVVTGTPRTADAVASLVDRLMKEFEGQTLTRFHLEHVAADFARDRLLALNGRLGSSSGLGGGGAQPGGVGGAVGALSNLDARLMVDQGNSLVFRGTQVESDSVRELLKMVDMVTTMTTKRYIVGAAVEEVARVGQELGLGAVRYTQQGGGSGGFGGFTGGNRGNQFGNTGGGFGQQTPDYGGSNFTVDVEAGAFTYVGNPKQQEIVEGLVKTYTDQQTSTRVEIRMYKLHNASAENVADVLTQVIADPSRRVGSSPFLPGARQGLANQVRQNAPLASELGADGAVAGAALAAAAGAAADGGGVALTVNQDEVTIVADSDRNQVIIRASARQHTEFERLIKGLDLRQQQVLIEAQIVAVRTNDNFEWTVETQINAGDFLLFSNFGLSVPQVVNGQPVGPKQVPAGNRGLTSAVIRTDYVPFVMRTLQTNADARLISKPNLLVLENQTGNVSSERIEPFSTVSQGTATTTSGQGGTATAGTSLEVTPRISAGGYISLDYTFELSSFDRSVAQAQGLQPPTQSENYRSTVMVPSDSTIVVGGFTLESTDQSESRIPLLGDIPLIGNLFKSFSRNKTKTTIFLFITPTIMSDSSSLDLRLASEGPMRDMKVSDLSPPLEPVMIPMSDSDLIAGGSFNP